MKPSDIYGPVEAAIPALTTAALAKVGAPTDVSTIVASGAYAASYQINAELRLAFVVIVGDADPTIPGL